MTRGWCCWHSFEPGVASFGLDGVITGLGLAVFGADFARLDPPQRLDAVKRLLGAATGCCWCGTTSSRSGRCPTRPARPRRWTRRAARS